MLDWLHSNLTHKHEFWFVFLLRLFASLLVSMCFRSIDLLWDHASIFIQFN